ncbi:universal stress protein [Kibdelosporangium lantanae]
MAESSDDTVLVGYDGSIPARLAMYWAVREAASLGSPLLLVDVVRWPLPEVADLGAAGLWDRPAQRAAAARDLDIAAEHCARAAAGVEVRTDLLEGEPVAVLGELARDARLLVLGSSGQSGPSRVLAGATATELVRRASTPVVVVRGAHRLLSQDHYKHVVVGVDGSAASERALGFAFDHAARRGADLVAVHAWCDLPLNDLSTGIDETKAGEEAEAVMAAMLKTTMAQYPDVRVRLVTVLDRPAQALLEESRTAVLVVVGDHGRARSAGPLGSVGHAVLHYAGCTVAVVHVGER